jgi:hypothetical protein
VRYGARGRKSLLWLLSSLMTLLFSGLMVIPATVANAAAKPRVSAPGTLEICKAAANGMSGKTFSFSVDGGAGIAVTGGGCSGPMSVAAGSHTIVEAPTTGLQVKAITANHLVSKDLNHGTVTVTVKAGSTAGNETLVTYTNLASPAVGLKVCKAAGASSPSLVGDQFSFTENGRAAFSVAAGTVATPNCGPVTKFKLGTVVNIAELATPGTHVSGISVSDGRGSNVNAATGTVDATIGAGVTVVTYTNDVNTISQTGFIEVCKYALDPFVEGSFNFTITDANGAVYNQSVLVGQCTAPIEVAAGNATVTEAAQFPYLVGEIDVFPSGRTVSSNLSNQTVTVKVVQGDSSTETAVSFGNYTRLGYFKVCKTLTANSSALAGHTFYFDVTSVGVTTDLKPNQVEQRQIMQVVAGAAGSTSCVIDPSGLPLGSPVSITEEGTDNVVNTAVSVSPASNDTGSFAPTANFVIGSGVTTATFTNMAFGTIEVCKTAADASTATQTFYFSVNGGAPIAVHAGQCSLPIAVPAGTATVAEAGKANFHLVNVTATGPTGDNRLFSGTNPVTVTTPFGGVENETAVTFTNAVNTGQFKICKQSPEPTLQGVTFNFTFSYAVNGTTTNGTAALTPGNCSSLSGNIPVVDPNGNPIPIYVTEAATPTVEVSDITVLNASHVLFNGQTPNDVQFSVNQGVTTVTYTNVRTPPPVGCAAVANTVNC